MSDGSPVEPPGATRPAARWVWPAAAALCALCAIPGVFTASRVFFVRDLTTSFLPVHQWIRRTILDGHLPLWCPYPAGGHSLVANPAYQILFPPVAVLRFLPSVPGFNLIVALPFPLAALGMFLFLRRRVSPPAACLGAVVVAASGAFLSTANTPNLAWSCALIPWVLLGTELVAERAGARRFALLASACGLMILAGEPVTFAATAGLALTYALFAAVGPGASWSARARAGLGTAGAIAAGALLGAIQILPLLDVHGRSIRAAGALVDSWSLHPARLVAFVMPYFFGKWVGMPHEVTQWVFAFNDGREPLLLSLYVGAGVLVLAVAGALVSGERRRAWFWCAVIPVSLVAAMGDFTPIYPAARKLVPFLGIFRFPSKHTVFTTVALGVLAALGYEALRRSATGVARRRRSVPFAVACALAAVAAALWLIGVAQPPFAVNLFERLGHALSLPNPAAAARSILGRTAVGAPHLFAAAAAAAVCIRLCADGGRRARAAQAVLFASVAGDLIFSNASINPTIDAGSLAPFDWVERTREHPHDRVFVSLPLGGGLAPLDDAIAPPPYPDDLSPVVHQAMFETLQCNFSACESVPRIVSAELTGLLPAEYLTLLREFTSADREARYRFLSWAGTRYFLVGAPPPVPAIELARLPKLGGVALYEVPPIGARAAVATGAEIEPDPGARVRRLFEASFDLAANVILDRDAPPPTGAPGAAEPARAAIAAESPNTVRIDAAAPADAFVVLLDSYDPNWRVEVDGAPAPLLRVDGVFRGARIPSGRHRIRFSYRPRPLVTGAVVSLLTAAGLGALVLLGRRGGRPT